jgi:hypothetical protein
VVHAAAEADDADTSADTSAAPRTKILMIL